MRRKKKAQLTQLPGRVIRLCLFVTLVQTVTAGSAVAADLFENLPLSDWLLVDGELVWRLPPIEYAVGLVFGLALALYSIYRFCTSAVVPRALLSRVRTTIGRFGHVRAIFANGFVYTYVFLVVGFAGLAYSGFFALVRDRIAETLPAWVSWGPAGASILATFAWTFLGRRFSWLKADGNVELEEMIDDLEEQSDDADGRHWLGTLAWSALEDDRQERISELAHLYSVGFVKHAVGCHCVTAIDKGRLERFEVKDSLAELDAITGGEHDRERFANRRRALQIASRIVPLEELEEVITSHDRRKTDRRRKVDATHAGRERRSGIDRRIEAALVLPA